ncbi:MAG: T9SS type A sorting domain-containing protein [Bacteroidales bacterium]|nr:T9SS type A sorting domain-containing protein [Bacteroidales bacterium]
MRNILILLFVSFYFSALSQNNLQFLSATTGAACQSIKYYNNYVFTGTGSTLRSYYVGAGHTTPYQYVFEYRYISQIIRMTVKDHYLYVAANYDGMTKWDISNPALPVKVFEILPDSTGMSTQAMAFKGDTIFLAQFSKVCAYKDLGNSFLKISNVCFPPLFGSINGIDIKDNLLAYTVTQVGGQNGVYIRDLNNNVLLSFYQVGGFLMENVIWGINNNLLHVMAGTNTVEGYFFTLDVSNPALPSKVFEDTVLGVPYGLAMALPYNAENHNDTIYVANWGGMKPGDLTTCYIRVYDASDTSDVHLINYLPAGLWHFDMTVHNTKMYVASEWYGIKTVDVSDMMNPVDEGNTLTGGWNISSDAWGNYLAVANEGYGFKLYNISDPQNIQLIKVKNDPGFCFNACFSHDGQYIYTTNLTYQGLRVYRSDSLIQTGFIQAAVCNGRFLVHGNRIFSKLDNKLNIIDVSNPYAPVVSSSVTMTINDMALGNDKLFISNNDSIMIYDVSGSNFNIVALVSMPFNQDAKMMAAYGNELFVFVTNKGLVKYILNNNGGNYSLVEDNTFALSMGPPTFMAVDSFGLYMAYRKNGLFQYNRNTLSQTGFYRTGLDYRKYTDMYGVQNLFCKNSLVFLVEYFSQTSILSGNPNFATISTFEQKKTGISFYPNPAKDFITIKIGAQNLFSNAYLTVHSAQGKLILRKPLQNTTETEIDISRWGTGVYFFSISDNNRIVKVEKIIVE